MVVLVLVERKTTFSEIAITSKSSSPMWIKSSTGKRIRFVIIVFKLFIVVHSLYFFFIADHWGWSGGAISSEPGHPAGLHRCARRRRLCCHEGRRPGTRSGITQQQQPYGLFCDLQISLSFHLKCRIFIYYTVRVADPHHFNADPDSAFHSRADLDPAPHQSYGNLRPLILDHPGLYFEPALWGSMALSTALFWASKASEFRL